MSENFSQNNPHKRTIRVFVSSTFRDMQAERDELVKRIFPQLRKLAEERGVTWGEVDLRWGITEEQVSQGKVLSICLDEIRECQPFFIGLLGERYGWVPDSIPPDVIDQEPWIDELADKSITELEILHGVLNNPDMASHAFFYFRDPAYIETIDDTQKKDFQELPTRHELKKYGQDQAFDLAQDRKRKLSGLKSKIKDSGFPVRENYQDPIELGQLVLKDMIAVIDDLYPEETSPTPLEREISEHEAYQSKLCQEYVGREQDFKRLDEHAFGDAPPLVILGPSGIGKSALLANWAKKYQLENPQDKVILYFVGSTNYSSDWKAMLRKVMSEILLTHSIEMEIPEEPADLRGAFSDLLQRIPENQRLVLILDGIDQLEDRDAALDLLWLPQKISENIRLFISTLQGRSLTEMENRKWLMYRLDPLSKSERKALIPIILAKYRKTLNPDQVERISSTAQCANPLFLRTLLEELRLFGIHEELDQRIDSYLLADSIEALYNFILDRYEQDYERDRPGLVRDAMQLLWASRRGLSQAELLDILGADGSPMPHAYWSPLYLAIEGSLTNQMGLLALGHAYLRNAVENRFLPADKDKSGTHERLADYFFDRTLNSRKISELPWQLLKARNWQRLLQVLTKPDFFLAAWQTDEFDLKRYWADIELNSDLRLNTAYLPYPDVTSHNAEFVWNLARLLHESGYPSESLKLREELIDVYHQTNDLEMMGGTLNVQAITLRELGDLDRALDLFKKSENTFHKLKDSRGVAAALTGQATILADRGEYTNALALHQKSAQIFKDLNDAIGFVTSIGSQAIILRALGQLDQALTLFKEEERMCREIGALDGIARSLGNQALIHHDRGNLDLALKLHQQNEEICRELGNSYSLAMCLGNQGAVLREIGQLEKAMTLHQEQEQINRTISNLTGLANSLHNQAAIHHQQGELEQALTRFREEEQIYRELGFQLELQVCLDHQAKIFFTQGESGKALEIYIELEELNRREGNHEALVMVLDNKVGVYRSRGDLQEALRISAEQVKIARKADNPGMLALALFNNAVLKIETNHDLDQAIQQAEEAFRLASNAGRSDIAQGIESGLQYVRNLN